MGKKPTYEELLKRVKQLEKSFAESKRVAKALEHEKKFSEKVPETCKTSSLRDLNLLL
jgi:hypothetical protein